MKRKAIFLTIISMLLMLILVSCRKETEKINLMETPDSRVDNEKAANAYMQIINSYKRACTEKSEDWLINPEKYISMYPNVNKYIMEMYHTPSHYDEYFNTDIPYELCYMLYDIDNNGISELLLSTGQHELVIFAIYTFNGEEATELGLVCPEEYSSYGIYTNNVIAVYNDDVDYYRLNENGYSAEKITLSFDEIDSLLEYQFIFSTEDWKYLGKDVVSGSNASQNSIEWNISLIENIREQILNHYTGLWQPDGKYTISSSEDVDNENELIFTLRYEMSDKKAAEIIANGGMPSANTLVTLIHVNKSTGDVQDADGYGDSWVINFESTEIY